MATAKRKTAKKPPLADENAGYVDFQDTMNTRRTPMILLNGTSVRFPQGWSRADMKAWRKTRGLLPPPKPRAKRKASTSRP